LCRSFETKRSVHGYSAGEAIAANQICQSIRGWYGATNGGRGSGSPGLAWNSYSFHLVSLVMTESSVPSKMISSRSRPTVPNAPYVFTRSNGSNDVFMFCQQKMSLSTAVLLD